MTTLIPQTMAEEVMEGIRTLLQSTEIHRLFQYFQLDLHAIHVVLTIMERECDCCVD